jgi:hypothetical protein
VTSCLLTQTAIAGDEALATFRHGLTGPFTFQLLNQAEGRLLIQLPVGVGKTDWLLKILHHAPLTEPRNDLVVVLVPRWDILHELLRKLTPGSRARSCGRGRAVAAAIWMGRGWSTSGPTAGSWAASGCAPTAPADAAAPGPTSTASDCVVPASFS